MQSQAEIHFHTFSRSSYEALLAAFGKVVQPCMQIAEIVDLGGEVIGVLAERIREREARSGGSSLVDLGAGERHAAAVLLREERLALQRPADAERRVVPEERALVLGRVVVGGLVEEVGAAR